MSEASEAVVVESAAGAEVQAQAEKLGWIPPARFKGDPERFVDAEDFIRRGEEVLPIVKKQLEQTRSELAQTRAEAAANATALKAAQDAIEDLREHNSVATQKAVEQAREQVKAQLAAASEGGDHVGVAELTDQLTKLNTAAPEKKEEPKPAQAQEWKPDADLSAWIAENSWWGTDKKKTGLALGIAQELREAGDRTVGRTFYERVGAEVAKTLGGGEPAPVDKVAGSRNGSEIEQPRSGGKKGYNNLPADAKAQCNADARQFVGPSKRYKTAAEWNARYAEIYFSQES